MNYEQLKRLIDDVPGCVDVYYVRQEIPKEVREEVYRRDKNRCAVCGYDEKLVIHHIRPDGPSKLENLILLCSDCEQYVHVMLHRLKGYRRRPPLRFIYERY
jgi:5-methylcytosine-specific restriction endonuclease McrA